MTIDLEKYNNFEAMHGEVGQDAGSEGGDWLITIKINQDFIEDNDVIRPGWFSYEVHNGNDKTKYYFPTFEFRPFVNAFQYRRFHKEDASKRNRSIIIKSMREEAMDEKGGQRCGKLTRKELNGLVKEEADRLNKDVNLYRLVMGTFNAVGVAADGTKMTFENAKAQLELRGTNFMPIEDTFKLITRNKTLLYNHHLTVSNIRKKNGAVTFYELVYTVDLNKSVRFEIVDIDVLTYFNDLIKRTNRPIIDKYNAALKSRSGIQDRKPVTVDEEFNDPIDDLLGKI